MMFTENESADTGKEISENYDFDEETSAIDKMNKGNQKVLGGSNASND